MDDYYLQLFKYNQVAMFQVSSGDLVPGIIRGVDQTGYLIVEFEDEGLKHFDIKAIQLKY